MVIRVIAGVVPMLCGALVVSGVIPVGKMIYGDNAPNPVNMIRNIQAADAASTLSSSAEDSAMAERVARARAAGVGEAQIQAIRDEALRHQADLRRAAAATPQDQRAGWAPKEGGWGR